MFHGRVHGGFGIEVGGEGTARAAQTAQKLDKSRVQGFRAQPLGRQSGKIEYRIVADGAIDHIGGFGKPLECGFHIGAFRRAEKADGIQFIVAEAEGPPPGFAAESDLTAQIVAAGNGGPKQGFLAGDPQGKIGYVRHGRGRTGGQPQAQNQPERAEAGDEFVHAILLRRGRGHPHG